MAQNKIETTYRIKIPNAYKGDNSIEIPNAYKEHKDISIEIPNAALKDKQVLIFKK